MTSLLTRFQCATVRFRREGILPFITSSRRDSPNLVWESRIPSKTSDWSAIVRPLRRTEAGLWSLKICTWSFVLPTCLLTGNDVDKVQGATLKIAIKSSALMLESWITPQTSTLVVGNRTWLASSWRRFTLFSRLVTNTDAKTICVFGGHKIAGFSV